MLTTSIGVLSLELLSDDHRIDDFDCKREPSINEWLKKSALSNQKRHLSRVYVWCCPEKIVRAYFCLSSHTLVAGNLRSADRPNGSRDDCQAQLLGRFATDVSVKGEDLGVILMDFVFKQYLEVLKVTTSAFICLDAKSDWHVNYYKENFGFRPSTQGKREDGTTFMYLKTSAVEKHLEQVAQLEQQDNVDFNEPAELAS
jgi:hypothetical protein